MLISVLLFATTLINVSDTGGNKIDVQLSECLSKSEATMIRAECYNKAYTAWDNDITATEKVLMAKADGKQKEKLRSEQSAWQKQRDDAFNKIADKYNKMRGTMYIPVRIKLRMEVLRKRALQLEKQLRDINVQQSR